MIDTILPEYTESSRDFAAQPLEKPKNWLKDIKDANVNIYELMHIYNYIVLYRNGFNNESENEEEHSSNSINIAFKIHETAYIFFFGSYIIIFFEGDITTFEHNCFDITNKYDLNKLSNKNNDRDIKVGILDEVFYQNLMNRMRRIILL